MNSDKTSAEDG